MKETKDRPMILWEIKYKLSYAVIGIGPKEPDDIAWIYHAVWRDYYWSTSSITEKTPIHYWKVIHGTEDFLVTEFECREAPKDIKPEHVNSRILSYENIETTVADAEQWKKENLNNVTLQS
ncbi:MAG: hypothetical protein ACFFCT_12100 [Candidatus Odinarchaeota archaeon]